jgi:nucleoside-diphosphate-sugar epimerase
MRVPPDDLRHVLTRTSEEVWNALRDRQIFITGGTGFFGRWLLESFAFANSEIDLRSTVVVLSRDPARFKATAPHLGAEAGIHYVRGDVQTFTRADVQAQSSSTTAWFDFVIHAATEASAKLNSENPLLMVDTIVNGTRAALEFAVASGAQRFLLTSSGAVYGAQPSAITHAPEEYLSAPDPTQVSNAYAEGKRLAELLCACYAQQHRLQPLIARCFAFVGPFLPLDAHFAIGNFIRDALRDGRIAVNGDGTPFRSYLYAADLVVWLLTILVKGEPLRAYNVGSEDDRSIREIAEAVAAVHGSAEVNVRQSPTPGKPPTRYVPSCRRAREELQLDAAIDLQEAIRRTMNFAKAQQ